MNKNELIAGVAGSAGISKTDASNAVDAVIDAISNALASGEEVRMVG
ncbi:MAG: DNA-binding protein HU, partial [Kordiimonadaceae bacterium]|nr:DNA-binding protein HU [Kordiimonadaceae bacterium]